MMAAALMAAALALSLAGAGLADDADTASPASPTPTASAQATATATPAAAPSSTATAPGARRSTRRRHTAARAGKAASAASPAAAASPSSRGGLPANSPFAAFSQGASRGPIKITSDSMTLDSKGATVLFSGHVHANQATGDLTSKTLKAVYSDPNFHEMRELIADGDVRISQGTRWVTGDHAVMDQQKHTVVMTGNPVVHDGEDQITGSRITVYLDTGQSVVEGARAVIFPRRSENTDNVAGERQ
jgi:lipopolysaccharide export system protein LptA